MTRARMTVPHSLALCLAGTLILLQGCAFLQGAEIVAGRSEGKAVRNEVHILRDAQGVPHIFAQDEGDLFFALGYSMAHDRLFQMDFYRHAAQGRFSEWFGNLPMGKGLCLVQLDTLLRSFGFEDRAKAGLDQMAPYAGYLLKRYTSGVNGFLDEMGRDWPPEYKMLFVRPRIWREEEVLAIPEMMGIGMAAVNVMTEVLFDTLSDRLGKERAGELLRMYAGRQVQPAEVTPHQAGGTAPSREAPWWDGRPVGRLFSLVAQWMPQGSNNWVVSGKKSSTGRPILANDPHVPLGIAPNFWYHVHLEGGGFSVEGLMYPGYPGFGTGWNGKVAWGVTNIMADQIDLYRERACPKDDACYGYQGRCERFEVKEEHIKVRMGRDRTFFRRSGHHGFLIPREVFENDYGRDIPLFKGDVSLRWVDTEPARFLEGQIELARASNRAELRQALEKLSAGPLAFNFVWADVEGNIGYQAVGRIPIREDNQGSLVRDGWKDGGEWKGYIPFDQLPRYDNPEDQFFLSANNRIVSDEYPYYIGDDFVLPTRAIRICELLMGTSRCTPQDFMAFQSDVYERAAGRLVRLLRDAVKAKGTASSFNTLEREAWEILDGWDLQTSADSKGAAIYEMWFNESMWNTLSDEFGEELSGVVLGSPLLAAKILDRLFEMPESVWFDDVRTKERETRDDILIRSFRDAVAKLKKWIGRDTSSWAWGGIHPVHLGHPLGLVPLVGRPFRIGTFNYPGDNDTVNAGYFFSSHESFPVVAGAASRMIVDLSRPDGAWFNCSTGMSGDPFSSYFKNLTQGWYGHKYFWTSRSSKREEMRAEKVLILSR